PGMDGLAVMRALHDREVAVPILVLTGHGDVPLAVGAMRLGAVDFLEKPYPPGDLLDAIRHACNTPVALAGGHAVNKQAEAKVACLSERQRAVLLGILKGQPNKIIAWELGLSIRTVEAYRAQMLAKLGVRGTAEAVRLAMAAGMAADPAK
ncbi:MAG TPA: LuxR C-terminal-related transcriptional regulator, partial [Allosphingosinicella sp.]|nr:LuxR C-terminal-related transcriptional regulator [Allosphingosinicella sp.]